MKISQNFCKVLEKGKALWVSSTLFNSSVIKGKMMHTIYKIFEKIQVQIIWLSKIIKGCWK